MRGVTIGAGLLAVAIASTASADWNQPSGGAIGTSSSTSDCCPSIALVGGAPEVAYLAIESGHSQVRVRRLEGSAFVAVGGTPSVSSGEGSGPP